MEPSANSLPPSPDSSERQWSAWLASKLRGRAEHRCPDGVRVDVLTDGFAIEVEWPRKWAESIGQAILYQESTNRPGAVILLMGRDPIKQEIVYYQRCRTACVSVGLRLITVDVRTGLFSQPAAF